MSGRHTMSFDDHEAAVQQRAMMAYAAVLSIQTITTAAAEMVHEADLVARLSSRIQRHSTGICNCPLPPVLGGTPS